MLALQRLTISLILVLFFLTPFVFLLPLFWRLAAQHCRMLAIRAQLLADAALAFFLSPGGNTQAFAMVGWLLFLCITAPHFLPLTPFLFFTSNFLQSCLHHHLLMQGSQLYPWDTIWDAYLTFTRSIVQATPITDSTSACTRASKNFNSYFIVLSLIIASDVYQMR